MQNEFIIKHELTFLCMYYLSLLLLLLLHYPNIWLFFRDFPSSWELHTPSHFSKHRQHWHPYSHTMQTCAKKRLLLYSCKNSSLDTAISGNGVKQVMTPAPRGILKHSISSCSSADSLHLHIPTSDDSRSSSQSSAVSPETPISPPLSPCSVHTASGWLDRKQVRFSSVIVPIEGVQGEHSVLEEDWSPLSEQDRSDITDNGNMVVSTKSFQKDSSPWKQKYLSTRYHVVPNMYSAFFLLRKPKIRYFNSL